MVACGPTQNTLEEINENDRWWRVLHPNNPIEEGIGTNTSRIRVHHVNGVTQ